MSLKVFYNNDCSICRLEINHYKKISNNIEWNDITTIKNIKKKINRSPTKLIKRLHVISNNKIFVGVDAFILIWSKIPKYKRLGKIISLPLIYHFAIIIYEVLAFFLYIKNFNQIKKLNNKH